MKNLCLLLQNTSFYVCYTNRAGAWNVPASQEDNIKNPHIVLCTNGNQSSVNASGYLMHELTHFLQVCEGRSGSECDDYYVNEVEAYKKQGKDLQTALNDTLWSVQHTKRCKEYQGPTQEPQVAIREHKGELQNKITNFNNCLKKAIRKGCVDLPIFNL